MTALTFVDDPAIERALGADVLDDILASIQPTGDCTTCGQPLGDSHPLRLDVNDSEFAPMVYTRHAACPPTPVVDNVVLAPASSYKIGSFNLPVHAEDGSEGSLPVIAVNPEHDVFVLSRDPVTKAVLRPLDAYRREGFTPLNQVPVTAGQSSVSDVSWTRATPTRIDLELRHHDFSISVSDQFIEAMWAIGGFAIMVTYRSHLDDLFSSEALLLDTLSAEEDAAYCWVSVREWQR